MVDISVRTSGELVLMCGLIITSAIINALVFGQFSVLTEEIKRDTNEYMNKLDLANEVMVHEKLPLKIK